MKTPNNRYSFVSSFVVVVVVVVVLVTFRKEKPKINAKCRVDQSLYDNVNASSSLLSEKVSVLQLSSNWS